MRRVFEGGVGVERGGREDKSIDICDRDSLETGREEGGDVSAEDILIFCAVGVTSRGLEEYGGFGVSCEVLLQFAYGCECGCGWAV